MRIFIAYFIALISVAIFVLTMHIITGALNLLAPLIRSYPWLALVFVFLALAGVLTPSIVSWMKDFEEEQRTREGVRESQRGSDD